MKCIKNLSNLFFALQGIVAYDRDRFQFVSGIKILPKHITGTSEEIWVVTDRLQKVMNNNMNFTEINFRVMKADVHNLTAGTVCAPP